MSRKVSQLYEASSAAAAKKIAQAMTESFKNVKVAFSAQDHWINVSGLATQLTPENEQRWGMFARGADGMYAIMGRTTVPLEVEPRELGNTYAGPNDRFIVSLIVGYGEDNPVPINTPEEAVGAALALTTDEESSDTQWWCFDRKTGELHMIEQGDAQDPENNDLAIEMRMDEENDAASRASYSGKSQQVNGYTNSRGKAVKPYTRRPAN